MMQGTYGIADFLGGIAELIQEEREDLDEEDVYIVCKTGIKNTLS